MDSSKSGQQSSLDSLRTVEFRQTLRGYHIDDVDEYLERVAVDAEALQEQYRLSNDRLRQAGERISQLERMLADSKQQLEQQKQQPVQQTERVGDETLQKTLLLAQKFVDQTQAEAEAQARAAVSKAEEQARVILSDAESKARSAGADTERKLREEVQRLEARRNHLSEEIEKVARHLDTERTRLRSALSDMMAWIDNQLHEVATPQSQQSGGGETHDLDFADPGTSNGGSPQQFSPFEQARLDQHEGGDRSDFDPERGTGSDDESTTPSPIPGQF